MKGKQDFFYEVTMRIASHLEVDQALRQLFLYLREYVPCDRMEMNYLDEDTGEMRLLAWAEEQNGEIQTRKSETLFVLPPDVLRSLYKPSLPKGFAVVDIVKAQDVKRHHLPHPIFEKITKHLEQTNNLVVRLAIGERPLGILIISAHPPARYTRKHAALLRSVITPLAIAFSNARRYEDLLRVKNRLDEDNRMISRELEELSGSTLIGADGGLRVVMEMAKQVSPLSSPVLLIGETGTGKEVFAHAIHGMSPRNDKPFVRVQCGAIPETLLDSELFGHEKGAFTGALATRYGRFERAHGGTIFLDEIGELTPESQVKLLRVLQEKEFERVGGSETIHADVRVIVATHRDLPTMVREGRFREDLYFRLNVFPMTIPPLRHRKEDIPVLVLYFMERKCRELNLRRPAPPSNDTITRLQAYNWPGNVRELQNVIERALITADQGPLAFPEFLAATTTPVLNTPTKSAQEPDALFPVLDQVFADHIRVAMLRSYGRIQGSGGAAELLGLQPNTLRARMRKLGIAYGRTATCRTQSEKPVERTKTS